VSVFGHSGDVNPDVVVVGGGAIGACSALELARRGATVALLERGPSLASGCSAGNAGLICPSHSTPIANPTSLRNGLRWMLRRDSPFRLAPRPAALPWLTRFASAARASRAEAGARAIRALSVESLELHAALAAEGLDTGFERRGVLNVYATPDALAAGVGEASRSGLRAELLDRDALAKLEPALAPAAGGVYYPDEAHCDPLRFVRAVGAAATAAGATVRTGVEVLALRPGRVGITVETSDGIHNPALVVLAAGAWSGRLARTAGVFLPLEGGKGYHVDVEPADGDVQIPSWIGESWVIATPLRDRLRLSGTLELAGLDTSIGRARVEAIHAGANRGLRQLAGRRVLEVWAGLRPCTPDGLPVVGSPAGTRGLVIAAGHAMKGISLAPVTGRLVADIVAGVEPRHDPAPFSPDRFRPVLGV
jgi:D-amino-acid dehydrogenase